MADLGPDRRRLLVIPALALARTTAESHLSVLAPRLPGWGWTTTWVDDVRLRVDAIGVRASGEQDPYVLDLDFQTYDLEPPRVRFVLPDPYGQTPSISSRWWPRFEGAAPFEFALHHNYAFDNGARVDQLVCFSHSRDYYYSSHSPSDTQRWKQGRHTLAATITRLHRVLTDPYYKGPSGADPL